ncbi:MAG: hypothetical protein ABJA79_04505 [Parafilimonas sp.]
MKRTILIYLMFLSLLACTATRILQPAETDLPAAQQRIPNISLTDLQSGYNLYVNKCSACHRLHNPAQYDEAKWKTILPEMYGKAKIEDEDRKQKIENYLIAYSKQP